MVYKLISSKNVIANVFRRFGLDHSDWVYNAIESIGWGLEVIGFFAGYEQKNIDLNIVDYKGQIPCEVHQIEALSYANFILPVSVHFGGTDFTVSNSNILVQIKGGFVHTNFEEGVLRVHALVIPVDEEGFPKVPDTPMYIEALSWCIIRDLILRGYKHSIINFETAELMWEKYSVKAQNEGMFPDIANTERFRKMWSSYITADPFYFDRAMINTLNNNTSFYNT